MLTFGSVVSDPNYSTNFLCGSILGLCGAKRHHKYPLNPHILIRACDKIIPPNAWQSAKEMSIVSYHLPLLLLAMDSQELGLKYHPRKRRRDKD